MIEDEDNNDEFVEDAAVTEEITEDAASKQSVRKRERKLDKLKRESVEFWRSVFSSEVGRREMYNLLRTAGAFEEKFACGPNGFPQPEATWFHAGAHSFGQRLFQSWTVMDREGVFLMLDEHDPRFAKPKYAETKRESE